MRRRLRQLLIFLCLILAVATAGMWVRSGRRADSVSHRRYILTAADGSACSGRHLGVTSHQGRVRLWVDCRDNSGHGAGYFTDWPARNKWIDYEHGADYWLRRAGGLGFGVKSRSGTWSLSGNPAAIERQTVTTLQAPHWFLVLLLSLPPAVAAVRWWRRRRVLRAMGADAVPCPACGYDCRATPGRCPECGHAPAGTSP